MLDEPGKSDGEIPRRIGPYEIIEELGRGGMGRVYAARQIGLGRIVALKVIAEGWSNSTELEIRFLREAQTIARLHHPHIVTVHESARTGGHMYFSMDYVAGGDLARRLRDRVYTPRETAALLRKVASALAYAHKEGVLHRDLKPSNILLDDEEPRLADFGLAAQLEAGGDLTATSALMGTPHYLAPEALSKGSAALSVASDLYALGIILFEMLTGRTPFAGASLTELATLHQQPGAALAPVARALGSKGPCHDLPQVHRTRPAQTLCGRRGARGGPATVSGRRADHRPPGVGPRPLRRAGADASRLSRQCGFSCWRLPSAPRWPRFKSDASRCAPKQALAQTRSAEAGARERLREAKLDEARAIRRTTIPGRRQQALAALGEAAQIRRGADLRDEALAALLLFDVKLGEKWNLDLGGAERDQRRSGGDGRHHRKAQHHRVRAGAS